MRWKLAITILIVGMVAIGGYGWRLYREAYAPVPPYEARALLATYSKNGVDVSAWLEYDQNHHPLIATTFAPQQPQFHLYGQSLPVSGIEGLGRPTMVALISDHIDTKGSIEADVLEETQIIGHIQLPVYPEGAVTLRLPIAWDELSYAEATLNITYMACSDTQGCLLPVENHPLPITLPISVTQ